MRERIELSEKDKLLVTIGVDGMYSQVGRFSSDWHTNNSLLVKWDACRWIRETVWWLLFFFPQSRIRHREDVLIHSKLGLK